MEAFRAYLIRLTAAAILASLIRGLAPKGGAGRAVRLGAGLLILLTALSPLARADLNGAAERLVRESYGDPLASTDFSRETNELLAGLISDQAAAYILDKADGLPLEVRVETAVEDRYPIPWRVVVRGSLTPEQKEKLSRIISEDLGVPEERQEWWSM